MINPENLINHSGLDSISRGGEIYLRWESIAKFTNMCTQNNIAIIGIEGFKLKEEKIIPDMDLIADFSCSKDTAWNDYLQGCNESTKLFFDRIVSGSNLIFCFTLLSEDEWRNESLEQQ